MDLPPLRWVLALAGAVVLIAPIAHADEAAALTSETRVPRADATSVQRPSHAPSRRGTSTTPETGETRGVAIDLAAISVDDRLAPGGSYRLPPLRVRNPGDAETAYEMSLRPGDGDLPAPSAWVTFTPSGFTLTGGAEQVVQAEVIVPPGAMDGHYSGLLVAQIVEDDQTAGPPGARVGAAAATRLDFQVVPASLLAGWMNATRRWLAETAPWSWLAFGGLALGGLLWWLSRRFQFRVERVARS